MLPDSAEIVIIGGGIAGASIAYHLAELGKRDVVVIEQGSLVSGTTSHAPGLVGQLRSDVSLTKMLMYSASLYRNLKLDGAPGFFEVGSLRLASSKARLEEIKQQADFAAKVGLEVSLLSPREAFDRFPLMDLNGVQGALFVPSDGSASATVLAHAMIKGAKRQGVSFVDNNKLLAIDFDGSGPLAITDKKFVTPKQRVKGIRTAQGYIKTETVVLAVGIWSPLIAQHTGVALPLIPMQHQYAVSSPMKELGGRTLPNLRDPDKLVYMRQNEDCFTIGGYERNPRPFPSIQIPERKDPSVQSFDPAHFEPLLHAAAQRVPCLANGALTKTVNGLESFTPDGEFLLGPATNVGGVWTACGFCAHGISGAGGVGKVLAEWIVNGEPGLDLSHMDPNRFGTAGSDEGFIRQNAHQVYSTYYDMKDKIDPARSKA